MSRAPSPAGVIPAAARASQRSSAAAAGTAISTPGLPGVAGAGHGALDPVPGESLDAEPSDCGGVGEDRPEHRRPVRALHGDDRTTGRDVVAAECVAHTVGVRGVRHDVEGVTVSGIGMPPHDDVVDHRGVGVVEQVRVLRPPWPDLGEVVGQRPLDRLERVGSGQSDGAEVRHVEHRRRRTTCHVFGDRPGRVRDRHLPSAELGHRCAEPTVPIIERRRLQGHRTAQPIRR